MKDPSEQRDQANDIKRPSPPGGSRDKKNGIHSAKNSSVGSKEEHLGRMIRENKIEALGNRRWNQCNMLRIAVGKIMHCEDVALRGSRR